MLKDQPGNHEPAPTHQPSYDTNRQFPWMHATVRIVCQPAMCAAELDIGPLLQTQSNPIHIWY